MADTKPSTEVQDGTPAVIVEATYKDPKTGALYVHADLTPRQGAWEEEGHVGPVVANEAFGDVDSWAAYVKAYVGEGAGGALLTWNAGGLAAVLDYHAAAGAGRCQWWATQPFVRSPEWLAWAGIATGKAVPQRAALEFLEDHQSDIVAPVAGELLALLRTLRATVSKAAVTQLRPDGTTSVEWNADNQVSARGGTADLPPEITIAIPVLKGHPVAYQLSVRLRANVDDQAHLALRFTIPNAERALEDVYADRVSSAKALLGDAYTILRGAG